MNCKPGDLCVFVAGPHRDTLVHTVRLATESDFLPYRARNTAGAVIWLIDRALRMRNGDLGPFALDRMLRPITPPDGSVTDEEVRKLYSGRELVNIVKERL